MPFLFLSEDLLIVAPTDLDFLLLHKGNLEPLLSAPDLELLRLLLTLPFLMLLLPCPLMFLSEAAFLTFGDLARLHDEGCSAARLNLRNNSLMPGSYNLKSMGIRLALAV